MRYLLAVLILVLVAAGVSMSADLGHMSEVAGETREGAPLDGFPVNGKYHVVYETIGSQETEPSESVDWIEASSQASFENLVTGADKGRCRNQEITVGGGSFEVTMTCDTADGEIKNARVDATGTYSPDKIVIDSTSWIKGEATRQRTTFRLVK